MLNLFRQRRFLFRKKSRKLKHKKLKRSYHSSRPPLDILMIHGHGNEGGEGNFNFRRPDNQRTLIYPLVRLGIGASDEICFRTNDYINNNAGAISVTPGVTPSINGLNNVTFLAPKTSTIGGAVIADSRLHSIYTITQVPSYHRDAWANTTLGLSNQTVSPALTLNNTIGFHSGATIQNSGTVFLRSTAVLNNVNVMTQCYGINAYFSIFYPNTLITILRIAWPQLVGFTSHNIIIGGVNIRVFSNAATIPLSNRFHLYIRDAGSSLLLSQILADANFSTRPLDVIWAACRVD